MTEVSKPSFLGRMGAMMGLMNASKFQETNKEVNEEGRLDSASTFKSRRNESQLSERPILSRKDARPETPQQV